MEHGIHIETPLPVGAIVNRYDDGYGEWFSINHNGMKIGAGWTGEYSLNPPPDTDTVFADLVSCGVSHEDAQQIVEHLAGAGMAI